MSWRGTDVSLAEVERQLGSLRCEENGGRTILRASVLTHIAWVPPEWREAAEAVLEGLGERHPSRTLILYPDPDSDRDAIDAEVSVEAYDLPGAERQIATEVVRLWLHDGRTRAPASIVLPLVISDLPVFLRWRGRPGFFDGPFEQLTDVADRLVVDSSEWAEPAEALATLAEFFDRVAVSDIAWARIERWRHALAHRWPGIADAQNLRVVGPDADGLLLAGWLRERLGNEIALEHEPAGEIEEVALDGEGVEPAGWEPKSPSDLLSEQLEIFGRDRTYERAVVAAS